MVPLTADHVFLADPATADDPERQARYEGLLSADERARQARFVFARDRAAFAVTRALVRTALSRHADVAPEDWRFAPDPHGRPRVVAPTGVATPCFSVAHTDGLIACLLTAEVRAAVDVERLRAVDDAAAIARRHFAPAEVAALDACADDAERQALFFALWTLKESYLKALGRGLSLPLDAAVFQIAPGEPGEAPGRLVARLDSAHGDSGVTWDFGLWQPSSAHRLAIARARSSAASPAAALLFFCVVPGEPAAPIAVPLLAA